MILGDLDDTNLGELAAFLDLLGLSFCFLLVSDQLQANAIGFSLAEFDLAVLAYKEITWDVSFCKETVNGAFRVGRNRKREFLLLFEFAEFVNPLIIFKADQVPIGKDQIQHLEICNDIAGMFNHQYKTEVLKKESLSDLLVEDMSSAFYGMD